MIRKWVMWTVLIATVGVFVGCDVFEDDNLENDRVQETTVVSEKSSLVETTSQIQNDTQTVTSVENSSQTNVTISMEKAKELALSKVSGATDKDIFIELDYDNGQYVYEGEIHYGDKEYDFEIDADNGAFLEWSEERR